MNRLKLTVEKRKFLGKKVKKLRHEDILPANIYGKNIKSTAVQVPMLEFEKIYKSAGETGLIDVQVNGEIKPSLIHNVQQDYYNHRLLHVDFYQVDLKQKVKTMVPLITTGEPKAVSEKIGLLLQPLSEIEVEALPEDLPENIGVNVESLDVVDAQITVSDLKPPKGIAILTESSQVVAKIGELVSKEAAEQLAAEQAAAEAAKAESDSAKATATPAGEVGVPGSEGAPAQPQGEGKLESTPSPAKQDSGAQTKPQK
ncbi:MAG: 50S ribosomal protein L25 [Candidatus Levybacteria bacterium]|nr:50S ribosomal protein L25 [Candidatus Levybacteria bacterium]